MRQANLCPSAYRPGDETNPASPYYEEQPADRAFIDVEDSVVFLNNAERDMAAGNWAGAVSEFKNAIEALQDAIDTLKGMEQ